MKKQNIFIIVIFFIVSLFISLLFNIIENSYNYIKENNELLSNNAMELEISNANIDYKDLLNILNKTPEVYLEKNALSLDAYYGKMIYFNGNFKYTPPLINGEFLNHEIFNDLNGKYCVLGKGLTSLIKEKNNKKYVSINGEEYSVIGIMGYSNKESVFDERFYVNINPDILTNINGKWVIDGENINGIYDIINVNAKKLDTDIKISLMSLDRPETSMMDLLSNKIYIIILFVLVVLTLLLNIVNVTNNYIIKRKKEFGIRRVYGATKMKIYFKIIYDYQVMAIEGFILSQLIYFLIIKFNKYEVIFGDKFNYLSAIFSFLVLLLIGIFISIIPIKKSNKLSPNEAMKGI